jgi:thioredoxin 1
MAHRGCMAQITHTTDDRFTADVLESDVPVLLEFTADWCPPCRMMAPVLAELDAERDDLRVLALDVDEHRTAAARYGVLSMPTFMLFAHGAPVATWVGARPKARLERELSEALAARGEQVRVEQPAGR